MRTPNAPKRVKDDQHFLDDRRIISAIVGKADLGAADTVLEIGGGTGNFSTEIAKRCGRLTVVEKDPKLSAFLEHRFEGRKNVSVIGGDILKVRLPLFNKIVANTPYSIIQQFFVRLVMEGKQGFEKAVLVVPYSFGKKMTASVDSGYFGAVSAFFLAFYETEAFLQIGKESFNPPPRVTSTAVSIRPIDGTSQHMGARLMLQELFLHNGKKVRNSIVRAVWNNGPRIIGRELTKREAKVIAGEIVAQLGKTPGKEAMALTDQEFKALSSRLIVWGEQQRDPKAEHD